MDFDLDDPLGDLLSDDSNGSFFGDTITKKTKSTAKEKAIANPKAKMANLFGVESDELSKKDPSPSKDTTTKISYSSSAVTNQPSDHSKRPTGQSSLPKKTNKKEINFDDSDDILQELGFDPKHPRTPTASMRKSNIIDDLLEFSKSSRDTSKMEAPKNAQATIESTAENTIHAETEKTTSAYRQSPPFGRPRTATRPTVEPPASDPLGFFATPKKKMTTGKNEEPTMAKPRGNKPVSVDWLGINLNKEITVDGLVTAVKEPMQPANIATTEPPTIANEFLASVQPKLVDPSTHLAQSLHQLDISTVQNEGALNSLKQQQNQLRLASQMKQQESILFEMHTKQKALLEQQERQFNELLQRQINRQAALEENIQRQQEQIGSYMNILLAQPATALPNIIRNSDEYAVRAVGGSNNESNEKNMQSKRNSIELAAEVKRLELEKLRLEDVLQSVRSNHEQELDLIENSHK